PTAARRSAVLHGCFRLLNGMNGRRRGPGKMPSSDRVQLLKMIQINATPSVWSNAGFSTYERWQSERAADYRRYWTNPPRPASEPGHFPRVTHGDVLRSNEFRFEDRLAILQGHGNDFSQIGVQHVKRRTLRMGPGNPGTKPTNEPGSSSTPAEKLRMDC
ncbi:MAG: hypothetical protein ABJB78_06370, partial [Betaproteobacteria bacterium]